MSIMIAESPNGIPQADATPPIGGNAGGQGTPSADIDGGKFAALADGAVDVGSSDPVSERDSGDPMAERQDGLDPEKLRYPNNVNKRGTAIGYRRDVARAVLRLKLAGDHYAVQKVARTMWPDTPNFSPESYCKLRATKEKQDYQSEKKLFESRKDTVKKWAVAYEKGQYLDEAKTRRRRKTTQGRPKKYKDLHEALYEYFLHVTRQLGGRCSGHLLRAKMIAVVHANSEEFPEAMCGGGINPDWAKRSLRAFTDEYELSYRAKNLTIKASAAEIQKRIGCFWRNAVRYRVWAGNEGDFDAYDHTPFYRWMNDKAMVAQKGQEQVGAREDKLGKRARFPVSLADASYGVVRGPRRPSSGDQPRVRGRSTDGGED